MHQLVEGKKFGFLNLDDERLVKMQNFDEILEAMMVVYENPKLLLLDEIQNLEDWELIVNRLQRQGYRLIITGSNSNLLSSELATHLTGRHLPVFIFTFTFSEYLATSEDELTEPEKKEKFNDWLTQGGYPEPLMKGLNKRDYLQVLFDSILYKDIVKRYKIRQPASLESLAVWLISNITSEFSLNSICSQVQISSVHTVKKYLHYLEESFVFFSLPLFSFKVGEQQRGNKKIYCFDNGFRQAKAFHISNDWGKLLENAVASELYKKCLYAGSKLFYWKDRDQQEVDFVVQAGTKVTELIQVCWDITQPKTLDREVRSLLKASEKLKCDRLLVINMEEEKIKEFSWFGTQREIEFIPAWKWMSVK
jgi:predicted AAA+ superfamily ATPase